MEMPATWKKCSSCKKEIPFNTMYYLCSVSTCRHKRTGYRFCSVPCWDAHLGFANHRSSFAEEARSPTQQEYYAELQREETLERPAPRRIIVGDNKPAAAPSVPARVETLVVVSRVKSLISDLSGFSTSQCCVDALTDKIVDECRKGVEKAKLAGRKTVMGRDIR